jgi:selenide,water dikinase
MTALNRAASQTMVAVGASAATDVTGYGLLGHLVSLCQASGVGAQLSFSALPWLPGAVEYARDGFVPRGTHTNLKSVDDLVRFAADLDEHAPLLLADPQTSGGLLITLSPDRVEPFQAGVGDDCQSQLIGRISDTAPGMVTVLR